MATAAGSVLHHPFDAAALRATRAEVRRRAGSWMSGDAVDDFVLAVDEVVTNAIVHGGGSGMLMLRVTTDRIACQVSDTGPGMTDPTAGMRPPRPSPTGGYGLWVARNSSSGLRIDSSPRGTTVHLHLTREDAEREVPAAAVVPA